MNIKINVTESIAPQLNFSLCLKNLFIISMFLFTKSDLVWSQKIVEILIGLINQSLHIYV